MLKKAIFSAIVLALITGLIACNESSSQKATQAIEVANFDLPDLIELRAVLEEVLAEAKKVASTEEDRLLGQANLLLSEIEKNARLENLVTKKTEEERFVLDLLGAVFSIGVKRFYGIPSPVSMAITKGAEELGNLIAEWQVLARLHIASISRPGTGTVELVYDEGLGEIWANFDIYDPVGRVVMYIPVEPRLASSEGRGNVVISEGIRPVMEECRIAYRVGEAPPSEPVTIVIPPVSEILAEYERAVSAVVTWRSRITFDPPMPFGDTKLLVIEWEIVAAERKEHATATLANGSRSESYIWESHYRVDWRNDNGGHWETTSPLGEPSGVPLQRQILFEQVIGGGEDLSVVGTETVQGETYYVLEYTRPAGRYGGMTYPRPHTGRVWIGIASYLPLKLVYEDAQMVQTTEHYDYNAPISIQMPVAGP